MKIEHIALYVNDLEVLSGPRTTGDGYYESCVLAVEGNQIEITVYHKRAEPAVKTRKSLLFLLWIYQPGSTTMPAAASEMMRYIFSGPNIA